MTIDLKHLCYYGIGTSAQWENVRQAKQNLGFSYIVKPEPATPESGTWRVLAFQVPDFICDYALVTDKTTVQACESVLLWALEDQKDSRPTSATTMLDRLLGPGVKEIPASQIKREKFEQIPLSMRLGLHL